MITTASTATPDSMKPYGIYASATSNQVNLTTTEIAVIGVIGGLLLLCLLGACLTIACLIFSTSCNEYVEYYFGAARHRRTELPLDERTIIAPEQTTTHVKHHHVYANEATDTEYEQQASPQQRRNVRFESPQTR